MATISTTENVDFTVPAAGTFRFFVVGKARLFSKSGSAYAIVGDYPVTGVQSGEAIVTCQEASATYKWVSMQTSTTVVVAQ